MKLRLDTKYFRPRVAIWAGFAGVVVFAFLTYSFLKSELAKPGTSNNTNVILILLLLIIATLGFFVVGMAGLKTYREYLMAFDRARLKRKGCWHKLSVLGDWLTK